jgi:hypothetical protein
MNDINEEPKRIQFANGCMLDCIGSSRSQIVPIMMASPRYIANRTPYTTASRRLLIQDRWSKIIVVATVLLVDGSLSISIKLPPEVIFFVLDFSVSAADDDSQEF